MSDINEKMLARIQKLEREVERLRVGDKGTGDVPNHLKNSSFERYTTTNKPLYYDTDGMVTAVTDGASDIGVVLGSYQKIENNTMNRPPSYKFTKAVTVLSFFHKGGSVQVQIFNQDTWAAIPLVDGQNFANLPVRDTWTTETVRVELPETTGVWVRITNIDVANAYVDNIMLGDSENYSDGPESDPWDNTATPYMVNEYNIQTQASVDLMFTVPYTARPYVSAATTTNYSYQFFIDGGGYYTGIQIYFGASGLDANVFVIGRL